MSSKKPSLWKRMLEVGNTDFCPNLNQYVYWLKQPIGWFVIGFAASLMAGVFIGPQGFVLASAMGTVILLGVCWPWLSLRGIEVSIEPKRKRVTEGEPLVLVVTVKNKWPIPVWGLALEKGFRNLQATEKPLPWLAMTRIGPWTETEFEWQIIAPMRGVYPNETPVVSNGFPFGLWRCEQAVTLRDPVLVWPKTFPLRSFPEIAGDALAIEGCETLKAGQEGEVIDIRNFRVGDTLRQVHWAQTARRGMLMVRERQNKSRREVRVTIDIDPEVHFGHGNQSSLEWAMRVAASICREFHAHHFHVSCVWGGQVVSAPDHQIGIKPILDGMSRFERPTIGESRLALSDNRQKPGASTQLEYVITTMKRQREFLAGENGKGHQRSRNWIVLRGTESAQIDDHTTDEEAPIHHLPIDLGSSSFAISPAANEVVA